MLNKKGSKMSKVTNLSKATEIVKSMEGQAKSVILEKLVQELSITRSNAFVYFTKASKILGGVVAVKGEKKVKSESSAKVEKKLSDIEKFVLSVKAAQVKASPFAQLQS